MHLQQDRHICIFKKRPSWQTLGCIDYLLVFWNFRSIRFFRSSFRAPLLEKSTLVEKLHCHVKGQGWGKTYAPSQMLMKLALGMHGIVPKQRNYKRSDETCLLVLHCISNSGWYLNLMQKRTWTSGTAYQPHVIGCVQERELWLGVLRGGARHDRCSHRVRHSYFLVHSVRFLLK